MRCGRDGRAGRPRLNRFLQPESDELDGEEGAEEADVRRGAGDCAHTTTGGETSRADDQEARKDRGSRETEARLDQRREVGMGSGALHGLRRRAGLELVNKQVSQLRKKDTKANQRSAHLERPGHAGIIPSGVAGTSSFGRVRSHTATKIGTMVSS